jgi:hypothetical protein
MLPKFLLPESIARADGVGPEIDLGADHAKLLVLTLGINRIIEQEGLVVSIWGSSDGLDWGTQPLVSFPQKYYCGMYSVLLNLVKYPNVRYLRTEWKMHRWSKVDVTPMFGFYVFAEVSGSRVSAAVA